VHLRQQHQHRLKTAIKWVLVKEKQTLSEFTKALAGEGVNVNGSKVAQAVFIVTYVDFKTKCVFNGSELGKEYSAKGVLEQLGSKQEIAVKINKEQEIGVKQGNTPYCPKESQQCLGHNHEKEYNHGKENVLELLLKPQKSYNDMPDEMPDKRKKKRQSKSLHM
jgi:hypothetical protein